jgi:catechol 2,3-dioxygenase
LEFYTGVLGLTEHWRDGDRAGLGAGGADLLRLTEDRRARRYRGTTGMYHFAILLPSRRELARVIARLISLRYPNSPTDHVMTKTTYLDDPEGNNIELYADTPEDGFMGMLGDRFVAERADGKPSSGRDPVDLDALFSHLQPEDALDAPMPPGTRIGHVHLYVSDLDESMRFYHEVLGMDNMGIGRDFQMGMAAAGGYHHHVGFNTWLGRGAPPAPEGALGLRYYTIVLPDAAELAAMLARTQAAGIETRSVSEGLEVRDPSGIRVVLETG